MMTFTPHKHTAYRIVWAGNSKSLTFGHRHERKHLLSVSDSNTYFVESSSYLWSMLGVSFLLGNKPLVISYVFFRLQRSHFPLKTWQEGELLYSQQTDLEKQYGCIQVRSVHEGVDDSQLVVQLLKKVSAVLR